jgi:trimeric autotransporter adhesin
MKSQKIIFASILLALGGFVLSPIVQAVVPPPDGGYPNGNTAEGQNALLSLTTGGFNTAVGWLSLKTITTGQFNTALGAGTLFANTADSNTAVGTVALLSNTDGTGNTATGVEALFTNSGGDYNTAMGFAALFGNTSGNNNTAIGLAALQNNTTGSSNIALGNMSGNGVHTAGGVICIGAAGDDVDNSCYIGSIWQQPGGSQAVYVNAQGKLGAIVSSRRFKEEIKPIDQASEAIYRLDPISFRYKCEIEPTRPLSFGLIAEDVEAVDPDLVLRDDEGKPYTVRYEAVNAMLLNEFLKEHRTVQAQQKEIDALKEELKDQRALIEKVTARIGMEKAEPQLVMDTL